MRKTVLILAAAFLAAMLAVGCQKAPEKMTKEKAEEALGRIGSNISVVSLRPGPVEGLWEVGVKKNASLTLAYLDSTGKYLFIVENVVNTVTRESVIDERMIELMRVDPSKIPLEDSIVMGDRNAKHKIFVFTDPDCPYCRLLHPEMREVVEARPDIAFYIKMMPLVQKHPEAYEKARSIMCAGSDEKSLRLLEAAYMGKKLPAPTCDTKAVDNTMALVGEFSINGTPTLFFPDGMRVAGAVKSADIIGVVDEIASEKKGAKSAKPSPESKEAAKPAAPAAEKK